MHVSLKHFATPGFWYLYRQLPDEVRELADKNFTILKNDPRHPSLRLKHIGTFWSARVGLHFRVLARERTDGLVWFWIGHHSDYDLLVKS